MKKCNCIVWLAVVLVALLSTAALAGNAQWIYETGDSGVIPFAESGITNFNEAPMLAAKVAAGELPPVAERLPKEPLVLKVEDEIGLYGGTLRLTEFGAENMGITGHVLTENPLMFNRNFDNLLTVPNVVSDWEFTNDGHTLTLWIREGIRWSDGELLTVEDFTFWYEHVAQNTELSPMVPAFIRPGGRIMDVTVVDDYTMQFDFAVPYFDFINHINSYWYRGTDFFIPAHFLKDYHPAFNPDVEAVAAEYGYDDWVMLFEHYWKPGFTQNKPVGRPTLSPWVTAAETTTGRVYTRNPYYFKVDPEGNQLPYIDELRTLFVPDGETRRLRALAGDIDYMSSFLAMSDYPTFLRNQESGGYEAWIGESIWANSVIYVVQQNFEHEDPKLAEVLSDKRFRQALSLAIDRHEINEIVFMGQGTPRQSVYSPVTAQAYKEEWGESYAQYDPAAAMALLDEMGLVDQNGDGWRQFTDGSPMIVGLSANSSREDNVATSELVTQYWEEIGVRINMRLVDESTFFQRLWNGMDAIAAAPSPADMPPDAPYYLPSIPNMMAYRTWLDRMDYFTGEMTVAPEQMPAEAVEPPQWIKDWYVADRMLAHVSPEEQAATVLELGDLLAEELLAIGTVGLVGHVGISNAALGNVRKVGDNPTIAATRNAFLEQAYWTTAERRGE